MSRTELTLKPFELRSADLAESARRELVRLFPEAATEGGKVDFDRLRLALGDSVDVARERFGLVWPGRSDCFHTIQTPSMATLRPVPGESLSWETTSNVLIEGDNLEVLKLLQKSYLGRIKLIYIDPPYNTGNDFIYPDNYTESLQTYLEYSGQVDSEGRRFGTNTDTEGRFHSKWLNMMLPRLYLARNLLRDDGVMFVSIGTEELHNLLALGQQVFGEENYCGLFVWEKKKKPSFLDANMGSVTDYIACFARDRSCSPPFSAGAVEDGKKYPFNNAGNGLQTLTFAARSVRFGCADGRIEAQDMSEGNIVTELLDAVEVKGGTNRDAFRLRGEWRYSQAKLDEFIAARAEIVISKVPFRPNYINRSGESKKTSNLLSHRTNGVPTNEDATEEMRALFGKDVMSHPKPTGLMKYLIRAVTDSDDIILDFFAGSGTTGHGVWQQVEEDGKRRSWIMVQLPEHIESSTDTGRAAAEVCDRLGVPRTIAEIAKERMRRAAKDSRGATDQELRFGESSADHRDLGFRVFKLDRSGFRPWQADGPKDGESLGEHMFEHVEHILPDRSADDLLYEILLKSGFPLTTQVETLELAGKTVFSVAGGALLVCLDRELTLDVVRAMAKLKPERVVCLDSGFAGNDQLKANAVLEFRDRGVTSFRTV